MRSSGLLHTLTQQEGTPALIGDFSLNAANGISAGVFLGMGLDAHHADARPERGAGRSAGAQRSAPSRIEVVAYQHLPVFHTEHCVFCRFLSNGTSYKDCGHPCEKHRVALRDVNGRAHPVMADVGCRNTVFGAEAQEASAHLDAWRDAGIRHYRLEFVHETPAQVMQVAQAFQDALAGRCTAQVLGSRLAAIAPQGVTEGSFFVPVELTDQSCQVFAAGTRSANFLSPISLQSCRRSSFAPRHSRSGRFSFKGTSRRRVDSTRKSSASS